MSARWELDLERATQAANDDAYAKRQERDETLLAHARQIALEADRRKFEAAHDPLALARRALMYLDMRCRDGSHIPEARRALADCIRALEGN